MSVRYRKAYAALGEERVQSVPQLSTAKTASSGVYTSEMEAYWAVRRDYDWAKIPGVFKFIRRTGKREFCEAVSMILLHLEPSNSFNPAEVWQGELRRMEEAAAAALAPQTAGNKGKAAKKKKVEEMKESNLQSLANKKLEEEVKRIRDSKRELLAILHDLKMPFARAIYLVEVLAQAYAAYKKNNSDKRLLYEVYWAVEGFELPAINAPSPEGDAAPLVYDNFSQVEELLRRCAKVLAKEADLVRVQLVDMSDSLPPLSKFSFGYRLDAWQKRVLAWIDAGKSVVICAPTSSGKTVLSSYVAVIFKSRSASAASKESSGGGRGEAKVEELLSREEQLETEDFGDEEAALAADEMPSEPVAAATVDADADDVLTALVAEDFQRRAAFLSQKPALQAEETTVGGATGGATGGGQRVLFVVPSQPLVWQVAAFFTKLLKQQGDKTTRVALVTDQLTFNPQLRLNVMPQIVVGTPLALESALTKSRGLTGGYETSARAAGDLLPGGFDHFDWVVYDEVHVLNGREGAALQRLIRAMNCRFLALSATVGNADELRAWLELVRGEQLGEVEALTVTADDLVIPSAAPRVAAAAVVPPPPPFAATVRLTVVRTMTCAKLTLEVTEETTVLTLKEVICARWEDLAAAPHASAHVQRPIQLFFRGRELIDDSVRLSDVGVLADVQPIIYVPSKIHALSHQSRFINLQRYLWDPVSGREPLRLLSPLAAVGDVTALREGMLQNSSLSFTPADCYRVWEEAQKLFPASALAAISPYSFFGVQERITLQRVRDYEDLLKGGLQQLARDFPGPTQELLDKFRVDDPAKEFDLCELCLALKREDMLPCLPFHLNTFDAIRLFQQLLAGLEYRQKVAFPTYYMDQQAKVDAINAANTKMAKDTGGDEKKLQELMRSGELETSVASVDVSAPHPKFILSKGQPVSDLELDSLLADMEAYDGFEKRQTGGASGSRGRNIIILNHALIRGLRRGIGLFIDEVGFPSYRRALQRLASNGKLGVVVSDSSLAFGVNMPFRTTIFCGEMRGELDELMAQQMSGRAGRRGLDTQGNIVYAGLRARVVRRLMVGKIARITGLQNHPRYDTLLLQPLLSPRHVGFRRAQVIAGASLQEFVRQRRLRNGEGEDEEGFLASAMAMTNEDNLAVIGRQALQRSCQTLLELEFIVPHLRGGYVPYGDHSYASLALVWELREYLHESITLGMLFPALLREFAPALALLSMNEKKGSGEAADQQLLAFFAVLLLLVGRTPFAGGSSNAGASGAGEEKATAPQRLQDLSFFSLPENKTLLLKWQDLFAKQQASLPEHLAHLRDPVVPGVDLDGTFFQCVLDRGFVHRLDAVRQQEMKQQLWHVGNVLKTMSNCVHASEDDACVRCAFFLFRKGFLKLRYLNAELVRGLINFRNVADAAREKRTDVGRTVAKPRQAALWTDLLPAVYGVAIEEVVAEARAKGLSSEAQLGALTEKYAALTDADLPFVAALLAFRPEDKSGGQQQRVALALGQCSFVCSTSLTPLPGTVPLREVSRLAVLLTYVLVHQPTQLGWLSAYLPHMVNADLLSRETYAYWRTLDTDAWAALLPYDRQRAVELLTEEKVVKIKRALEPFTNWLEQDEEEEEEEEDDEEEEG